MLVIILGQKLPFLQLQVLLILSTINLIWTHSQKPFASKLENLVETLKELCIYMQIYIVIMFSSKTLKSYSLKITGDVLVGLFSLTILLCLLSMAWSQMMTVFTQASSFYKKFKKNRLKNAHLEHRKKVIETFKGQFSQLERQFNEEQAKAKCRKWKTIRDWYISNNIAFAHMPDEIEYLTILKQYSFQQRQAVVQKLNQERMQAKKEIVTQAKNKLEHKV